MDTFAFEVLGPALFDAMLIDGSTAFLQVFDWARDPVALSGFEKRETVAKVLHVCLRLPEFGRSFQACHGANASLDRIRVQGYARIIQEGSKLLSLVQIRRGQWRRRLASSFVALVFVIVLNDSFLQ